jgi:hypothetical protein
VGHSAAAARFCAPPVIHHRKGEINHGYQGIEAARETHLGGPVGKALAEKADELFASAPDISNLDVIANKL